VVFVAMVYKTVFLVDGREAVLDWARKKDLPEILEVVNDDVIREGIYGPFEPYTSKGQLAWFEQNAKIGILKQDFFLIARVDGKVVGGANVISDPEVQICAHVAHYNIFISKNFRNLGLGTILTKEFVEIAKQHGVEVLQLGVYASNERAFHVYQKCGFKQAGRLTRCIKFSDGTYTDQILMEYLFKH
jgi:RimJ/RimL family protein N-acetyltransferase